MTAATLNTDPIALTARIGRVLELRRAITEGTYEVDHEAVATALLREWAANSELAREEPIEVDFATMESMRPFVVRPELSAEPISERVPERRILTA